MNLLTASKLVKADHVYEAINRLKSHSDFTWLYAQTGREEPDHRYVVVRGRRYPSKAFGFFVAQIAGDTDIRTNDMNVNQAVAPLKRLGYQEVSGPGRSDSEAERQARKESYYLTLARPQQARFRESLIKAYNGKCAISGCTIATVLEAAHIVPFRSNGLDDLKNGILLRTDLHRLFDAYELAIEPVTLCPTFSDAGAEHYRDMTLKPVALIAGGPTSSDFRRRWKAFCAVDQ